MKLMRALLTVVFLLTAFATLAQAPGRAVGFIPLLSKADPDMPIQVQTRDAMNALMPKLLAAQQSGQILEFEPSLVSGVLKMVYRPSLDTAALFAGKPVYAEMKAAAASMRLPKPVSTPSLRTSDAAAATGTFTLYLYDNYVHGSGLGANARVTGSLRDKSGRQVSVFEGDANASGDLNGYFTWNGSYADVAPGFRVVFREYEGDTLLNTYQAVAPTIKFNSIDKANSIVKGTGPADLPFQISWRHRNWNAANNYLYGNKSGTTSATGAWSVDFGAVPLRGADALDAFIDVGSNFTFDRYMAVPYMYCKLGGSYCSLYGLPSTPAAMKIVNAGVAYNSSGRFSRWGDFGAELTNASGDPIFLKTGARLSGTNVPTWVLPNLTTAVNYTTDMVSGKAPANKYFNTWVYRPYTSTWYFVYSRATSLGSYAADFASQIDLVATQPVIVELYFQNPATGNVTDYYRSFGP